MYGRIEWDIKKDTKSFIQESESLSTHFSSVCLLYNTVKNNAIKK